MITRYSRSGLVTYLIARYFKARSWILGFLPFYLLLFTFHCSAQESRYVRVAVIQDTESLSLKINGAYEIIDPLSREILSSGKVLKTTVAAYGSRILIADKKFTLKKILLKVNDREATISLDGRLFRGDIQLIKKDNLHLAAVNYVELEDYVKGILYHEVSHYWPQEALKAQAVICRTYALYQIQESASRDYDVTADIYSQVYGGRTSERYRTNQAVEDTKAETIIFKGKIFPAYYHATCAGHTEDASLLWNINIPPLKGVVCGFCRQSPHFSWHEVLTQATIKTSLKKSGYADYSTIKDIVTLSKDASGRIKDLNIITDKKEMKIAAKDFRNIVGPNIIKSTNFKVRLIDQDVIFEGSGWGHGAGLCQWGAYFMAKEGKSYKDILKYYYPQSNVKTIGF